MEGSGLRTPVEDVCVRAADVQFRRQWGTRGQLEGAGDEVGEGRDGRSTLEGPCRLSRYVPKRITPHERETAAGTYLSPISHDHN